MEVAKKQKSISKIFAKYIAYFCIVAVILALLDLLLFGVAAESGLILPANYYEQLIEKHRSEIAQAEDVNMIIPKQCDYAVYDLEGKMLQGNVLEEKSKKMWNVVRNEQSDTWPYYYKIIQRNGEVCVVEYTIASSFASSNLKKYIPNAELDFALIFVVFFIIEIIIISKCFRRRILKEMQILKDTTKNIQMENLDFKISYSNIIEINEVLCALDKMKTELNESLGKQWNMEEVRKGQIAALAHDIKTPLTIIKGNSELLNELELNQDQKEFNDGILNAVDNIESYTKSLMEIIKSEKETTIQKKQINLEKFIQGIIEQGVSMSIKKELEFISEIKNIPDCIFADGEALKRAVSNVISNSVNYCDVNGRILFYVDTNDNNIRFIIEDSGRGFTTEEIHCATKQFFQGDKSRNSPNHYGIGLYIVRKLIEQHNGRIKLESSEKLGGAKVILEVPVSYIN